jgi:hypothetical protein
MPDEPNQPSEKKIIIDEDWKTQVQAEKEKLKHEEPQEPGGARPAQAEKGRQAAEDVPLPPATLSMLMTSLGMQAMVALGLVVATAGEVPKPRLNEARHLIDTLALLEEKTAGNRTVDESALLESLLHELRMSFVAVQSQTGKAS